MPTLPATILDHLRTLRGEGRTLWPSWSTS